MNGVMESRRGFAALATSMLAALVLAGTASAAPPSPTLDRPQPFDPYSSHDGSLDVGWAGDSGDAGYRCAVVPHGQPTTFNEAAACESGWNTGSLDPGLYDVWVWAVDGADAPSAPATVEFQAYVDGVATISGSPNDDETTTDPVTHFSLALANPDDMAKNVAFGADDDGFVCQIDGTAVPGLPGLHPVKESSDWSRCPADLEVTLADGPHTLNVASRFQVGDHVDGWSFWGPMATRTFTVDTHVAREACAAATASAAAAAAKVARVRDRLRRARSLGHKQAARRYRAALKRARAAARAAGEAQRDAC